MAMNFPVMKRRSARQVAGRKRSRSIYYDGDTDDDLDLQELSEGEHNKNAPSLSIPPPRPQRSRKRARSDYESRPATRTRNRNTAGQQNRSIYYEGDTEEDEPELVSDAYDEGSEHDPLAPSSPPPVPQRRRSRAAREGRPATRGLTIGGQRHSVYYEGDSEDEDPEPQILDDGTDDDQVDDFDAPLPPAPIPQRRRARTEGNRKSRAPTRKHKSTSSTSSKSKRWDKGWSKRLATPKKSNKEKKKVDAKAVKPSIPSDDVKPDWTSLPINILRDIFMYASQAGHEQTIEGNQSNTWLMKTAYKTCTAFAVPALEAYYASPELHNVVQPHHLLELLRLPYEDQYIKYQYKIKQLQINVRHLAYNAQGRPAFDISELVRELPQLQHLEVVHPVDEPPYRPLKFQKWHYPPNLFSALEESGTKLRTWRWSRDMMLLRDGNQETLYTTMATAQISPSFERLRHLVVCGFDFDDSAEPTPAEGEPELPTLTSAISLLPSLKDLTFISCDIVMEDFLSRLPKTLERLELTNCLEVTADMLQTYLVHNGSHLRELVLNSNAALSLAFLPSLKAACPNLETLKMDTTYYSEKTNYNDAYAFYEHLLMPSDRPIWPSTLRHLELTNLQKLGSDAASVLFQSLIDSAPDLRDLRRIIIQAHIDIAWRDRADFRDNWVDKLRSVFLSKSPPPLPYLCSLKRYREWKEEQPLNVTKSASNTEGDLDSDDDNDPPHRNFSHIRITPRKRPADHTAFSEDDTEDEAPKGGRRIQTSAGDAVYRGELFGQ